MNIFEHAAGFLWRPVSRRLGVCLFLTALALAAGPQSLYAQAAQAPPPPAYTDQPPEQLQQLVAPIALYADSLVAQILAASTYPEQIVEADRWVQAHPDLKGEALAQAVNQQPWDASVKALTAFPAVLGNMDRNLSWTSSLGDAYYNQPQDVMAAVQVMRQRAQSAGNLMSTPQQTVTTEDSDIAIEPASPDVVYVPAYDPWLVYGVPLPAWPGWYPYPGIWFGGPYLSFGVGFPIGFFAGFAWGWHHWGCNWRGRQVLFNHGRYFSRSVTFFNRRNFYGGAGLRGGAGERFSDRLGARAGAGGRFNGPAGAREGAASHFGAMPQPFNGNAAAARGYGGPSGEAGIRSGAFSGFSRGGETRGFAARGRASFGGGGAPAGGMRGGGARGGGGRR